MRNVLLGLGLLALAGAGCVVNDVSSTTDAIVTDDVTQTQPASPEDGGEPTDDTLIDVDYDGDPVVDDYITGGDANAEVSADAAASVSAFAVSAESFAFTPSAMTVKKGDTVRITLTNVEGFHDFVVDEFDVATNRLASGASETVEFVADKAGTFEFYCSVGSHRQMGMKGTLTVTK